MKQYTRLLLIATTLSLLPWWLSLPAQADPGAALRCPSSSVGNKNLAPNPSFETAGPKGANTTWKKGDPTPAPSAAKDWFMHSDNNGSAVTSRLVNTNVPGPGGRKMLRFTAGGNEGGIYFDLRPNVPAANKIMFSAWVKVVRGQVAMSAQTQANGPTAWSSKAATGQWEQLRVCTDGSVPINWLYLYNQDPAGGDFFVDRVEVRTIR